MAFCISSLFDEPFMFLFSQVQALCVCVCVFFGGPSLLLCFLTFSLILVVFLLSLVQNYLKFIFFSLASASLVFLCLFDHGLIVTPYYVSFL
jgi:hypothetical protein